MPDLLSSINHIVVLMLENRSFDQMLGFLYADRNNIPPIGPGFEGLTGREANPDDAGELGGLMINWHAGSLANQPRRAKFGVRSLRDG